MTDENGCESAQSFTINDGATPILTLDTTSPAACGQDIGAATVSVTGGTGILTYTWSHDSSLDAPSITDVPGDDYTVTVSDEFGCSSELTITIDASDTPIIAEDTNLAASCGEPDGSTSVSVTGGTEPYTYTWSHDATLNSNSATNLAADAYLVTVTDANGCSDEVSISVGNQDGPVLTIDETNDATCGDDNGTATVSATDGTGTLTYTWSHDASIEGTSVGSLAPDDYSVTVTDANGCESVQSFTIAPSDSPVLILETTTPAACGELIGSATVSTTGGTGELTYDWAHEDDLNSPTTSGLPAGTYNVIVLDESGCSDELEVIIEGSTAPEVVEDGNTPTSCGQSDGAASVSVTGGAAPYSYLWSHDDSIDSESITDLSASNYTVTVTDTNGCTDEVAITIANQDGPVLAIDATTDATCGQSNGSATVATTGGTGTLTYVWSHDAGITSAEATDLPAGDYTVTVTDGNACESLVDITINDTTLPTLTEATNTPASCGSDNGSLSALAADGTGTYTYVWSHDAAITSAEATDLPAGDYTVTVTDEAGCTATVNMTLTGFPGINITEDAISAASCGESNGTASVAITDGTEPVSYTWSHDATVTGASASNLPAGEYTITVTDANTCTSEVTVTVANENGPEASGTATAAACASTDGTASVTATGGTAPYTYLWNDPLAQTTANVTGLAPGDYITTVTDANNCIITTTVTVEGFIPPPVVTCGDVTDTSVEFLWTAVPGAESYEVTINGNTQTVAADELSIIQTGAEGETISISVTAVGAVVCGISETVDWQCTVLTTNCPPQPADILNLNASYCLGDGSIPLTANPAGGSFMIDGLPATNLDPASLGPGVHDISYSYLDADGCLFTGSTTVSISNATVTASPANVIIASGSTIALNAVGTSGLGGALSYTWSPAEGLSCTDCANPIATPNGSTTYTVTVVDEYGCAASASVSIGVTFENTVVVPNAFSPNGDGFNDLFRVRGNNIEEIEVHIYNRWGQEVYNKTSVDLAEGWDGTFKDIPMEIGVYVYYAYIRFKDNPNEEEDTKEVEFIKGNVTLIR